MNIVLINPPHLESLDPILDPPLGLMYLASVIKSNTKHEVSIVDLSFHTEINKWKEVIPKADIYGITVMTPSYHHAIRIRDICKEINPNCKIIVGGPHPTALPYETMHNFDIIVVGDGEGIIIDIINYIQNNNHYPKIFYGNDKFMHIDEIPFPARDMVPIKDYTRTVNGENATSIISGRGCPYSCAFCINSTRKDKVRFRSIDNIIKEMKELIYKYDYRTFIFYDDILTIRPDLDKLLEEIGSLNIIFRCNVNARNDGFENFKKLYNTGCREVCMGIESGSQEILDKINKKVTVEQNRNAISNAKKAGLLVKAFLMLGNPGESWDTIEETVKFMNKTRPDYWTIFTFIPLPGCEIYNNPEKYGIKIIKNGKENNLNWKEYYNIAGQNEGGLVCETEYMTIEDIKKARRYMLENLPKQTGPLQKYYSKL